MTQLVYPLIKDQILPFDFVGLNKFRGIALSFLDLIPPLKKRFVKKMSYGK